MTKQTLLGALAAVAVTLGAPCAFAATDTETETFCDAADPGCEQGYGYKFKDDALSALNQDANGGLVKVRVGPVRRTLIRPRTNFVPEMLKTVEII